MACLRGELRDFFATFLYLIAFVGGLPVVPVTVDHGPVAAPPPALTIDLGLIALFGLQHSVMPRPAFKAWWTTVVSKPLERSFYVLAASLCLVVLFALWQPIAGIVWSVQSPVPATILWALFAAGWAIVLSSILLINHVELFGLMRSIATGAGTAPSIRGSARRCSTGWSTTRCIRGS